MATYVLSVDTRTGRVIGVVRDGSAAIPRDAGNIDWQEFLTWNAEQQPPLSLADQAPTLRVPRPLLAIEADILALTPQAKRDAIFADLFGASQKWATNLGVNRSAMFLIYLLVKQGGISATNLAMFKAGGAALYCQDVPNYLVNPTFNPTINIPGDQLVV